LALGLLSLGGALVFPATVVAQSIEGRSTAAVSSSFLAAQDPVRQASEALLQWRRDWENRDFERFSAHYSEAFQSAGLDRVTYLERKRGIFEKRPWQRIRINEVLWIAEQGTPDTLLVRFVQEYDSPQGSDRSRKEQRWIRANRRWLLASEAEVILSESEASRARPKPAAGGGLGK
jgi:murein L,D-transpeptidase YafK